MSFTFPEVKTQPIDAQVPPLPLSKPLSPNVRPDWNKIAGSWISGLVHLLEAGKFSEAKAQFLDNNGFWRDVLALTWDFKTFIGSQAIEQVLKEKYQETGGIKDLQLTNEPPATLESVPVGTNQTLEYVQSGFRYNNKLGKVSGIFRIVNTDDGWKGWTMYTAQEELHGHPERIGEHRPPGDYHGTYLPRRAAESSFKDSDPRIVIVGAGHTGLDLAARLKVWGIEALVLERNERIGDNWRKRYEGLTLHDFVQYDHLPFLPFPKNWPKYCPAPKLANWLEHYADVMELNVWTSSNVTGITKIGEGKGWEVELESPQRFAGKRKLRVRHVITAVGLGGGQPNVPKPKPGQDKFRGPIFHSSQFKNARDFQGKHVVVVGSGTSGHDVAMELYDGGAKVTMLQRSSNYILSMKRNERLALPTYYEGGPDPELADRIAHSFPVPVSKTLSEISLPVMAENDKELLDGLRKVGFQVDLSQSFVWLIYIRGGSYYLEVGCSQLIIDKKIGLYSGVEIDNFREDGIVLNDKDRTEVKTDAVIWATGYGDARTTVFNLLTQEEVKKNLTPTWGLDDDWEIMSIWRNWSEEGLYYAIGNLALSRYYSKFLALQLLKKEIDEGHPPPPPPQDH